MQFRAAKFSIRETILDTDSLVRSKAAAGKKDQEPNSSEQAGLGKQEGPAPGREHSGFPRVSSHWSWVK